MSEKRITVAEVISAFQETGYKPLFGDWAKDGGTARVKACALACMWTAGMLPKNYGIKNMIERIKTGAYVEYGCTYINGFLAGWDFYPPVKDYEYPQRWTDGYADGLAARAAMGEDA